MNTEFTELFRMKDTTDFRYMWTLSAGEAEPPQANRMLVTKALPHDVAVLAFLPLNASCGVSTFSLIPLESPHFTTIN